MPAPDGAEEQLTLFHKVWIRSVSYTHLSNVEPPDEGFMEERLEIFRAEGLKVQLH